jgi:hypothetical protein
MNHEQHSPLSSESRKGIQSTLTLCGAPISAISSQAELDALLSDLLAVARIQGAAGMADSSGNLRATEVMNALNPGRSMASSETITIASHDLRNPALVHARAIAEKARAYQFEQERMGNRVTILEAVRAVTAEARSSEMGVRHQR